MKKTIFFFIILLILTNCKDDRKHLNIITDQITLFEFADYYNIKNKNIKISIDYLNTKDSSIQGENTNIFRYIEENKLNNYDIIIGEKGTVLIDKKRFSKITKYTNCFKTKEKNGTLYPVAINYLKNNNDLETLYSIDFPVIVARRDSLPDKLINEKSMDIEAFCNAAKSVNQNKSGSQFNESRIGFSPFISNLKELDYYFIFNSKIEKKKNNYYSFNTPESQKAYDFFMNYDEKYNFGENITKKYIKLASNIDKSFYLKEKIVSFDFLNISAITNYTKDLYKIFLAKNNNYIGLNNIIITIQKSSINKKEAGAFIDFLYDYDTQKTVFEKILKKQDFYSIYHIPPVKNIIKKNDEIDIPDELLEKYIEKLKAPYYYNNKVYSLFFEKYYLTKDMVNKGFISEKDFLEYFTKELNK